MAIKLISWTTVSILNNKRITYSYNYKQNSNSLYAKRQIFGYLVSRKYFRRWEVKCLVTFQLRRAMFPANKIIINTRNGDCDIY